MTCQPRRWWWGLLPLIALWLLAAFFQTDAIQRDVAAAAGSQIQGSHPWARVAIDGRDVTLSGVAPLPDAPAQAAAAADAGPGVRLVNTNTSVLAEARPWTWGAQREANRLTLTGHVPSEAVRNEIVAAALAAAPGAEIVDQQRLARGVPSLFNAATAYSFAQIARLPDGRAQLSDTQLIITGTAPTPDAYDAAVAAGLPSGLSGSVQIGLPTERPYRWQAERAAAGLTLSGFVPSQEVRQQIATAAAQAVPGVTITDRMRLAAGAPAGFAGMAAAALNHLNRLSTGNASLADTGYTITGAAQTPQSYQQVIQEIGQLPQGYVLQRQEITAPAVSPYLWSAERAGSAVTLAGFVPSQAVRAGIVEAARALVPGAAVTDGMLVAGGAPAGFESAVRFGLGQLGRLSAGTVSLRDTALSLMGTAPTPGVFQQVMTDLRTLPAGYSAGSVAVTAPTVDPYSWSAQRSETGIRLAGFVPDEATRSAVVATARLAHPGAPVSDQQQIAAGAPAGFAGMTTFGLKQLSRLTSGQVDLSATAYSIVGVAASPADYSDILAATRRLPAGFTLARADLQLPTVRPYRWQAQRDGTGVTLTGLVPSETVRGEIVTAARAALPGVAVTDRMGLAAGAPAGFAGMASAALGHLSGLASGIADLVDTRYSITGVATTPERFADVMAAARALPAGYALARADIQPPTVRPYVIGARKAGTAVTLTGLTPSAASRTAAVNAARSMVPGATVTDLLQIAAGAPNGFDGMVAFGMGQLGRLTDGRFDLSDTAYSIVGAAPSSEVFQQVMAGTRTLPAGFTLARAAITVPPPPAPPPAPPPVVATPPAPPPAPAPTAPPPVVATPPAPPPAPAPTAPPPVVATPPAPPPAPAPTAPPPVVATPPAPPPAPAPTAPPPVVATPPAPPPAPAPTAPPPVVATPPAPPPAPAPTAPPPVVATPPAPPPAPAPTAPPPVVATPPAPPPAPAPTAPPPVVATPPAPPPAPAPTAPPPVVATPPAPPPAPAPTAPPPVVATPPAPPPAPAPTAPPPVVATPPAPPPAPAPTAPPPVVATPPAPPPAPAPTAPPPAPVVEAPPPAPVPAPPVVAVVPPAPPAPPAVTVPIVVPPPPPEPLPPPPVAPPTAIAAAPPPPPPVDLCRTRLAELSREQVYFQKGRAELQSQSFPLLDRVATVKKECRTREFEIAAHTDSDGPDDYNLDLSQRRAQSVMRYLVRAGVPANSMTAVGYGESRPIAPNDTSENKARNRRVEFIVK